MKTATISIATTDYYVRSGGRAVGRRDVGAKDQCKTQEALHAKTGNNGAHGRPVQNPRAWSVESTKAVNICRSLVFR